MARVGYKVVRAVNRLGAGVGGERETEGVLTTRRHIRAVELQPDFKTIQIWPKILSIFRWLQFLLNTACIKIRLILR